MLDHNSRVWLCKDRVIGDDRNGQDENRFWEDEDKVRSCEVVKIVLE